MKNPIIIFLFLVLIFGTNTTAICQWSEIRPPYGIWLTNNLVPINGKVYTTCHFKSNQYFVKTEDLIHWKTVSKINTIPIDGENYYDEGIFYIFWTDNTTGVLNYSLDKGENWTKIEDSILPAGAQYFQVFNHNLFVATDKTIYRSSDLGNNWGYIKSTTDKIVGIKYTKGGSIIVVTSSEVLVSSDNGVNWSSSSLPYPKNSALAYFKIFSNDAGIFISAEINGKYLLYRSINNCQSWLNLASPNNFENVTSIISFNDDWWAVAHYIYHSNDEGMTWNDRFGVSEYCKIENVNDTLYCSGKYGFFKSYDKAKTWKTGNVDWDKIYPEFTNKGIDVQEYGVSLDFYHDKLYYTNNSGIYSSDVNGEEWEIYETSGMGPESYDFFFAREDTIGFYGQNGFFSKDNGKSWNKIITQPGQENDPYNKSGFQYARLDGILFSANQLSNNLFRSSDWGITWQSGPLNLNILYEMRGLNGELFASTNKGIYGSLNLGIGFGTEYSGIGANMVENLLSTEKDIFCTYKSRIYKFSNISWVLSDFGLYIPGKEFGIAKIVATDELMIALCYSINGSNYKKLYYTKDGGNNWSGALSDILPNIYLFQNTCTLDHNIIYYSGIDNTERLRVFKIDIESVGVKNPKNKSTISIFPNPGNGLFNLKTNLQSGTWKVFNLLGALVKEGMIKDTEIDLSGYPNGVYFIAVDDGKNNKTESLILISNKL